MSFNLGSHYQNRLATIRDEVTGVNPDDQIIVLFGDSMSEANPASKLAGMRVMNQGISGDEIHHPDAGLLPRIQHVGDANPAIVLTLIGVNDLNHGGKSAETVAADYERLASELKRIAPQSRIMVQTCLPTSGKHSHLNPSIVKLNDSIRQIAQRHEFELVDLHPLFSDESGQLKKEYTYDDLHLNDKGYAVLNAELERAASSR